MKFVAITTVHIGDGRWQVERWDFRQDGLNYGYARLMSNRVFTKRKWAERYIRRAFAHRPKDESWLITTDSIIHFQAHALCLGFRLANIKTSGQGCVPVTGCVPRGYWDSTLIGCLAAEIVRK